MTPNFMTFVLGKRNSILAQNRARQRAAFSQPPSTNRSRDREGAFAGLSQGPNAPSRSRLVVQPSALGLHGSGGTAQRRPWLLGSAHHGVRVVGVVGFPLPDQCQQLFPHAFDYPRHRKLLAVIILPPTSLCENGDTAWPISFAPFCRSKTPSGSAQPTLSR